MGNFWYYPPEKNIISLLHITYENYRIVIYAHRHTRHMYLQSINKNKTTDGKDVSAWKLL